MNESGRTVENCREKCNNENACPATVCLENLIYNNNKL